MTRNDLISDKGLAISLREPALSSSMEPASGLHPSGFDHTIAGHTPGPWAVSKTKVRRVTNAHGVVICNAVLRNSGTAKGGIKHGAKAVLEAEANAAFIVRAVNSHDGLIDAARKALNFIENTEGELGITLESGDALRAAIARATAR